VVLEMTQNEYRVQVVIRTVLAILLLLLLQVLAILLFEEGARFVGHRIVGMNKFPVEN
jgi:hypothetical protein